MSSSARDPDDPVRAMKRRLAAIEHALTALANVRGEVSSAAIEPAMKALRDRWMELKSASGSGQYPAARATTTRPAGLQTRRGVFDGDDESVLDEDGDES